MQKVSFTNLSPDAQKTAIVEAFRSIWYLDDVLDIVGVEVRNKVCEHFKIPDGVLHVDPMFSSSLWSLNGDYPVPIVMVRLNTIGKDDLSDFVIQHLHGRVEFNFNVNNIVGVDCHYMDGCHSARVESSTHIDDVDRLALDGVVSDLICAIGSFAQGYVRGRMKDYYTEGAIRNHLEELAVEFTYDGRMICEDYNLFV